MKIKKAIHFFLIIVMSFALSHCSTYTVKRDISKNGELTKTPRWYVKYEREDKKWIYETAASVSPDLELSVKKSVLLAKAKLADRINGEMNNRTTITKNESTYSFKQSLLLRGDSSLRLETLGVFGQPKGIFIFDRGINLD